MKRDVISKDNREVVVPSHKDSPAPVPMFHADVSFNFCRGYILRRIRGVRMPRVKG